MNEPISVFASLLERLTKSAVADMRYDFFEMVLEICTLAACVEDSVYVCE